MILLNKEQIILRSNRFGQKQKNKRDLKKAHKMPIIKKDLKNIKSKRITHKDLNHKISKTS